MKVRMGAEMFVTESDYTPWLRLGKIRKLERWCIIKREV
jgi:hypothetical protein